VRLLYSYLIGKQKEKDKFQQSTDTLLKYWSTAGYYNIYIVNALREIPTLSKVISETLLYS